MGPCLPLKRSVLFTLALACADLPHETYFRVGFYDSEVTSFLSPRSTFTFNQHTIDPRGGRRRRPSIAFPERAEFCGFRRRVLALRLLACRPRVRPVLEFEKRSSQTVSEPRSKTSALLAVQHIARLIIQWFFSSLASDRENGRSPVIDCRGGPSLCYTRPASCRLRSHRGHRGVSACGLGVTCRTMLGGVLMFG